jgi:hypothetical protein
MNTRYLALVACSILGLHSVAAVPVRVLAWDDNVAARKLSISSAKGTVEILDMHPFERTAPVEVTLSGDTPAALLAIDRRGKDGQPVFSPLEIPEGMKAPLLLLLPDKKSPTGVRQLAVEENLTDFPWGTVRFINMTGTGLVFRSGKTLLAIPGSLVATDFKPAVDSPRMGVEFFLADRPEQRIFTSVWEYRSEFRNLVFIASNDNARGAPISFKTIIEDRRAVHMEEQRQRLAARGRADEE